MIKVTITVTAEHVDRLTKGDQVQVITEKFDGPYLGGPNTVAEEIVQLLVPSMEQKYFDVTKPVAGAVELVVAEHRRLVARVEEQWAAKQGRQQMGMFEEGDDDDGPVHRGPRGDYDGSDGGDGSPYA